MQSGAGSLNLVKTRGVNKKFCLKTYLVKVCFPIAWSHETKSRDENLKAI